MRLGQSAAAAATPTRALPLATSTEIVAFHAAEKRYLHVRFNRQSESRPRGSHHTNSGIMIRLLVNNHSLSQHETHS